MGMIMVGIIFMFMFNGQGKDHGDGRYHGHFKSCDHLGFNDAKFHFISKLNI
jgi:hypothetical protein